MTKYIIKKPPKHRREEIKEELLWLLEDCDTIGLPINLFSIIDNMPNTSIKSYSEIMKIFNIDYSVLTKKFSTDDACAHYNPVSKQYLIIYNDYSTWKMASNRYRWNIAHEIGHVVLGHNEKIHAAILNRTSISDKAYDDFEIEADYFAQLLLVPHAALWGYKRISQEFIHRTCQISWSASEQRYEEFKEWYRKIGKNDYDYRIHKLFTPFLYKKKCNNCGIGLIQRVGKYCPICGNKNTLEWGDGDKMKYRTLETYENGKLKVCPTCANEETEIDGVFCHICGSQLVNKCENANCGNTSNLPSNARFCPMCGGKSSFLYSKFLKTWTEEIEDDFQIPEVLDQELPFATEESNNNFFFPF